MLDDNPANKSITDNNRQPMPQTRRPSDACMEAGKPHRFKPGRSGNPGGRPKKIKEVADKALDGSLKAIEALNTALNLELAKGDEANPHVIAMLAEKILDRGVGRAPQSVDVNQNHSFSSSFEQFVREMQDRSNPEVRRLIDETAAEDIDFDDLLN